MLKYKSLGQVDPVWASDFGTGKVSFNHDSSQISFNMDQFDEFENGYFSGISKDKVKNFVVMNLGSSDEKKRPT